MEMCCRPCSALPGFADTSGLCTQTLMMGEITPQKGVALKLSMPFILLKLTIFLSPTFFALLYDKYR